MTVLDERAAAKLRMEGTVAGAIVQPTPVVDKGLVAQLVGEMTAHLGYEKHERAGEDGSTSARNGTRGKTVLTKVGLVEIQVPGTGRARSPVTVAKWQRGLGLIEDVVLSLSARGMTQMTHGDIAAHLADVYGSQVSTTTVPTITGTVLEGMQEWQGRPLDPVSESCSSTRST